MMAVGTNETVGVWTNEVVGRATGDESFQAATPFPVTVVPSELIR